MDPERWKQIERIYQAALDTSPDRRDAFLSTACGDDEFLRLEVASLLAKSERSLPALDAVAWQTAADRTEPRTLAAGERLGPYQIVGPLGEGGMGKVYRAVDTRLRRAVAIKISAEEHLRRFEREARAISALNHPHICTLYDVGSLPSGATYLVTELVDGEPLSRQIEQPRSTERSVDIARQVLEALRAAHAAGIVHRDLKPANIVVRTDGYVKVLDFGLAKRMPVGETLDTQNADLTAVSLTGQIIGTAAYMSPEQILGEEVDARTDLFALGIILYELLTGRYPWPRQSTVDTLHAILHDEPPALTSPLSGIVDKLLRKNRAERFASADAVLQSLVAPETTRRARTFTRLIVLPFRVLRPNETSDFLSISLPDAITSSLSAVDSLVVRSMMVAAKLASVDVDVTTIAERAEVDAILTGTVLALGDRLRVTTQLVQAPDGRVLWSDVSQASLTDVFQLQDSVVDRIVHSLGVPLSARERRELKHDVPANAAGYEFYLRANQLVAAGYTIQNMLIARDLYRQSVDSDPSYAPAWACLGRAYRYIGKFVEDYAGNLARAEDAFQRAFTLNPNLALAHNFYTSLETDTGRSLNAMERLIARARTHPNDPNLFTALVQACRYCDLLDASLKAHERARHLDPNIQTSVGYTYLLLGDFEQALAYCPTPTDGLIRVPALMELGRRDELATVYDALDKSGSAWFRQWATFYRTLAAGDRQKSLDALNPALDFMPPHIWDPEGVFCNACLLAKLEDTARALSFLSLALDRGYRCHYGLLHTPWLESLRADARFAALVARAEAASQEARAAFVEMGGGRLLS